MPMTTMPGWLAWVIILAALLCLTAAIVYRAVWLRCVAELDRARRAEQVARTQTDQIARLLPPPPGWPR